MKFINTNWVILYTEFFWVTRLIINKINKVQWVDFKLENVLVSLHSLNTMGLGSITEKLRILSVEI
jgi:hypothetical protein